MKGLSQKDITVISGFCGEVDAKKLDSIQKKRTEKLVKVVNTGMVSAGKSSLYNALTDSHDERFPVKAPPGTTTKADSFDYGSISYIDTPGIATKTEDEAVAFDELIKSDIIMMIHNVRTGPLHESEVEWLGRIVANMPDLSMRKERMIFVFSWKDTREREKGYDDLIKSLRQQVYGIVGVEIPCFEVSVKKYSRGVAENKPALMEKSGVPELRAYLEEHAAAYLDKKQEINNSEYDAVLCEVRERLQTLMEKKEKEKDKIYEQAQDKKGRRQRKWEGVFTHFSWMRSELSKLEKELKDMVEKEVNVPWR